MNKIVLLGRVGSEPVLRRAGEHELVKLSLATDRSVRTDEGWETKPDWHTVQCWDKQATYVVERVHTGDVVAVEGSLRYDQWVDGEGNKKTRAVVRAYQISVLGRPQRSEPRTERAQVPDSASVPF